MFEGATKTGAPQDDVCTKNGAIRRADAIFEDFAEHGQPVQYALGLHSLDRRGNWQPCYRNDRIWRQAAVHPVFDQRHRRPSLILVKRTRTKLRRSYGCPRS